MDQVPEDAYWASGFMGQEPHLIEKLRMLTSGELQRPIDIFDLFLHGTPLVLLLLKVAGDLRKRRAQAATRDSP